MSLQLCCCTGHLMASVWLLRLTHSGLRKEENFAPQGVRELGFFGFFVTIKCQPTLQFPRMVFCGGLVRV
ncbi:hypothetical protein Q3G72_015618 [Acer saccharum]|nr:hypothetical protein Q3G72_015618 [Acer saccharum]